jgi:hypothetical protein
VALRIRKANGVLGSLQARLSKQKGPSREAKAGARDPLVLSVLLRQGAAGLPGPAQLPGSASNLLRGQYQTPKKRRTLNRTPRIILPATTRGSRWTRY